MSANVDLVSSIYAAWESGDFTSGDWAHPEIEFMRPDGPEPGSWTGVAGMAEYWRDFLGTWQDFRVEAEEYRELDRERVLVLAHFDGRGKTSGLEIGQIRTEPVSLFRVRAGKVMRLILYWDRDRALAELGLAPEGDANVPD